MMKSSLFLLLFMIASAGCKTGKGSKFIEGIKVIQKDISKNYTPPKTLLIKYIGDGSFSDYYYSDLTKNLKKRFNNKSIQIDFFTEFDPESLGNKPFLEIQPQRNPEEFDAIAYVNIDNFQNIRENQGHNRELSYKIFLKMIDNKTQQELIATEMKVCLLHDVNSLNRKVSKKLRNVILNGE